MLRLVFDVAGLLKDSLRKYWLEQIHGMETAKAKAHNKTARELADLETVSTFTFTFNASLICLSVIIIKVFVVL